MGKAIRTIEQARAAILRTLGREATVFVNAEFIDHVVPRHNYRSQTSKFSCTILHSPSGLKINVEDRSPAGLVRKVIAALAKHDEKPMGRTVIIVDPVTAAPCGTAIMPPGTKRLPLQMRLLPEPRKEVAADV